MDADNVLKTLNSLRHSTLKSSEITKDQFKVAKVMDALHSVHTREGLTMVIDVDYEDVCVILKVLLEERVIQLTSDKDVDIYKFTTCAKRTSPSQFTVQAQDIRERDTIVSFNPLFNKSVLEVTRTCSDHVKVRCDDMSVVFFDLDEEVMISR